MTDKVDEHIKNSSCLIVPFKVPHFSRTLIEFGLAGVPAIVYDKEPINQIIINNHNGFVCKPTLLPLTKVIENIIRVQISRALFSKESSY